MGHAGLVSLRIDYGKVTITHGGRSVLGRGGRSEAEQIYDSRRVASRWRDALKMKDAPLENNVLHLRHPNASLNNTQCQLSSECPALH